MDQSKSEQHATHRLQAQESCCEPTLNCKVGWNMTAIALDRSPALFMAFNERSLWEHGFTQPSLELNMQIEQTGSWL
eukprot:6463701-Amphidinium_carterae.1